MTIKATLTLLCIGIAIGTDAQVISRLKAKAVQSYDGTAYTNEDSSIYNYSYSRGSDMKSGLYSFDTSMVYTNDGGVRTPAQRYIRQYESNTAMRVQMETAESFLSGNWENKMRITYHYPSAMGTGNLTKTDTIFTEQWNKLDSRWHPLRKKITTYNSSQAVTSELELLFDDPNGVWVNNMEIVYTYNGNRLVNRVERIWDAGAWVNMQQTGYVYNGNNLARDTTQRWNSTIPAWERIHRNDYTYNAGGNNTSVTYASWNGTAWAQKLRNEYEYNGTLRTSDTFSSWDAGTSQWQQNWLYTFAYDNAQNLLTTLTRTPGPDSFLYYRLSEWTYNSYNQPTQMMQYEWDFATDTWAPYSTSNAREHYYYELFNTHVGDIAEENAALVLYPVPASSFVNIAIADVQAGGIRLYIHDISGRLVKFIADNSGNSYQKNIIVSDLPSGQYILRVSTGNKEMTKAFTIER